MNVNGLRDDLKRDMIFDYLSRRKFNIVFLQETHSVCDDEISWSNQWKGKIYFSHGKRNSCGVAILISDKSGLLLNDIIRDKEGRWIKGNIQWNSDTVSLASVYAPNIACHRVVFFNKLEKVLDDDLQWLIGGDFNCNLDRGDIKDASKLHLNRVLQKKDLIDTWKTVYPDSSGFTHFHKASRQYGRIDYLFLSDSLLSKIGEVNNSPTGLTDHHVISLRLNDIDAIHGSGRWICNNDLLNCSDCNYRIRTFWSFWKTQKKFYGSLLSWWEIGKFRIKEIIQDFGREKSANDKREINRLKLRYESLISSDSQIDLEDLNDIENALKQYEMKEWEKAKIRTRNIQKSEGEKPSKFFLNLEKQQINSNRMIKVVTEDGGFVDHPESMIKRINEFYQNLFKQEAISPIYLDEILSNINTVKFDDDINDDLERDISESELQNALSQMKKNTSPGIDGLTVEF